MNIKAPDMLVYFKYVDIVLYCRVGQYSISLSLMMLKYSLFYPVRVPGRVSVNRLTVSESNWESCEHQKYFWNVIVVQEKKPIRREKTELQARTLISLWFCG